MAWLALIGTAIAAVSQAKAGQDAANAARLNAAYYARSKEYEAEQLEQIAAQEAELGERRADEERRTGAILQSRARALAAASGGSATDPTVVKIISDLAGESEYFAATRIYEGEEAARRARMGAAGARYSGESALATGDTTGRNLETAGYLKATSTIFSGAGSMYGRYGTMNTTNSQTPGIGTYR